MGLCSKQDQQRPEPLKCPRCDSSNTKFCYYNNYNRSQPRHFCKACKRHWTKGGTLRNVPVGGGRKNKRLKTSNGAGDTSKASTAMEIQWQAQQQPLPPTSGFEFLFSSSSPFDTTTPSSISTSFQSPSFYNYTAEPTKDPNCTISQTWQVPITSTSMMNMTNFWNLDDIDALVSTDINIPWDEDYEIKP